MPFALIVRVVTMFLRVYVSNTNDGLIKNPFLPHAKRGGWAMRKAGGLAEAKAAGTAVQRQGRLETSLTL